MATLVVAGVGAYVGGSAGLGVAGTVFFAAAGIAASYIDQRYIYPELFGRSESSSERVQQQQQVRAREGAPIPSVYGVKNRIPGSLVWLGRIDDRESAVSAGGGKGGGAQTVYIKEYFQDGLVIFCEGPIAGWQRLYANGEVFWDSELASLVVGGPTYFWPPGPVGRGISVQAVYSGGAGLGEQFAWVIRTDDEEQQRQFRRLLSGSRITFSGIFGGTFQVRSTRIQGTFPIDWTEEFEVVRVEGSDIEFISAEPTNTTHYGLLGEIQDPQNIIVSSNFRVNITGPLYDLNKVKTIDFTYGEGLNDPSDPRRNQAWPQMLAEETADKTPDYAGLAWVGFGELNRNQFLNTFPVALEAEIAGYPGANGSYYAGDIIERILGEQADLSSVFYDVSGVGTTNDDVVDGYTTLGPQPAIQAISPLLGAFDILTQQDGESTKFISKRNVAIIDVPPEHIDSFEVGSADDLTTLSRESAKLPTSIAVDFIDVDRDLEPGSVKVNWPGDAEERGRSPLRVNFPVAMTKTRARKIGWRLLRASRNNQQRAVVTLPPYYEFIGESDAIRFTFAGQERIVIAQRVDQSTESGLIRVEGIEDDPLAVEVGVEDYTPERRIGNDFNPMRLPVAMMASVHSLPPLQEGDHLTGGVYAGFYTYDPNSRFRGAIVYESPDLTPRQYTQRATRQNRDICGITRTALPSATKSMLGVWDMSSTVDVQLFGGELESRGKDVTAHGYEYAIVGSEVIRFAHAELIDTNTYRLSQLIRGLRDTEDAALATHTINEPFMLFSKSSGAFIPSDSGVRARRHWKVVSPGGDLAFALERTIESQDATLRPFSVGNLKATGSAGSNIEVSWIPRTNRLTGTFSFPETDADSWVYEVKVEHGTAEQPPFLTTTVSQPSYSLTTGIQGTYEINPGTPLLISVRRLGTFSPSKWKTIAI